MSTFTRAELIILGEYAREANEIIFECTTSPVCSRRASSIVTRPCCGASMLSCIVHDLSTKVYYDHLDNKGHMQRCPGCGKVSGRPIVVKL